jgi:RHS repeat-associated protein
MAMTRLRNLVVVLTLTHLLVTNSAAPQATGSDPFIGRGIEADKSYQTGGIDTIDLSTGKVAIAIPIGPRYPVGGNLSYGLTLAYDSSIWDFESYIDDEGHPKTKAYLSDFANAGIGWRLSLGELFAPGDSDSPQPGHWVFVSSDAGQHSFKTTLHDGEANYQNVWYTRDGTYLRLFVDPAQGTPATVALPSGVEYTFEEDTNGKLRLTTIEDQFGNQVGVAYDDVNHTETITDSIGRSHLIEYEAHTIDGETRYYVDRASMMTFGDTGQSRSAVFEFDYTIHPFLPRSARHNSPLLPSTVQAAVLQSLHLPEVDPSEPTAAGKYSLSYCLSLTDPDFDDVADAPGMLRALRHPTGGGVKWTFTTWDYYAAVDDPSTQDQFDLLTINMRWAGVATKTLTDRSPSSPSAVELGTWQYESSLVRPGPPDQTRPIPQERVTTVTTPSGDFSNYYFRAMPHDIGDAYDHQREAWSYGLPFTYREVDPIADGHDLYLSAEHWKNAAPEDVKLRSVYVGYDRDDIGQPLTDTTYRLVNRHQNASMIVYHDDPVSTGGGAGPEQTVDRWAATYFTDFDGLGHYRTATTNGNFSGSNARTSTTNYNPNRGTYPGSFTIPAATGDWMLNLYDFVQVTEDGNTARTDVCFDQETGAPERTRTIANNYSGTSSLGAHDIIVKTEYNNDGNPVVVRTYGGDLQEVGTGSNLCSLTLPTLEYTRSINTWSNGSLATTLHYDRREDDDGNPILVAMPFFSAQRTIDMATGIPSRTHDTTGLYTDYEYDARLRPTWVKPQTGLAEGNDAWLEYAYIPFSTDGVGPKLEVHLRPNGSTTGTLATQKYEFDPLGRRTFQEHQLPNGTWTGRTTTYNAQGWITEESEWGTAAHTTTYSDFDPFGRPTTTTLPDGKTISKTFTGVSKVEETVDIYVDNGGTHEEVAVTSIHVMDRFGREHLTQEADGVGFGGVTTFYDYDVGSRLSEVSVTTLSGTQERVFTYDNRGFLLSERHPEKGPNGNGWAYYSEYDALGNPWRKVDGDITLLSRYDGIGRILGVDTETSCGFTVPMTTFIYADQNGAGERALGKLKTVASHNYFDGVEDYCSARQGLLAGEIFSDGFEDGTTNAWTATYTSEQYLLITQKSTYGGRGGRVSKVETSVDDDDFEQTYAWDELGALTQLGYPDLQGFAEPAAALGVVTNTYTNGYLTGVVGFANNITYSSNGALAVVAHSNGINDAHWPDLNSMYRPRRIQAKQGSTVKWDSGAYSYDGAGNIKGIGANEFVYDKLNRLVRSEALQGTHYQGYQYDLFGNLTAITDASGTRTQSTSTSTNRLNSPATYDAVGNLTAWGGYAHQWRPTGEMRERIGSGVNNWYAYDAGSQRIVTHDRQTDTYSFTLRDLAGNVLRVFENDGSTWSWAKDYVYRNGLLLASKDATGTYHFSLDHLGTPRLVTNSSGTQVSQHDYFGFGEEATSTWRDEAMKFTGHERDLEGTPGTLDDLDYMRARYYNPIQGRFLSVDPIVGAIAASQSWNRYTYVGNSPLNFVDPFGLSPMVALAGPMVASFYYPSLFGSEIEVTASPLPEWSDARMDQWTYEEYYLNRMAYMYFSSLIGKTQRSAETVKSVVIESGSEIPPPPRSIGEFPEYLLEGLRGGGFMMGGAPVRAVGSLSNLKNISGKNLVAKLRKAGATVRDGRGSHVVVELGGKTTTVPVHGNQSLGKGLLAKIKRDLGL